MIRQTISRTLLGLALLESVAQGVNIYVTNKCEESMTLAHVTPNGVSTDELAAGGAITKSIAPDSSSHVFKSGTGAQATLAEFSTDGVETWVDISVIPTGLKSGPENCASLQACKDHTGGVGFNVAMQITPHTQDGDRCVQLTCMYDGCNDAYLFPKDDTKTHTCPLSTDFDLLFCPGGSGASTSVTQSDPTPAYTPALAPESAPSSAPSSAPESAPSPAPESTPSLTPALALTLTDTPEQTSPLSTEQTSSLTTDSANLAGQEQQNVVQSYESAGSGSETEAGSENLRKVNSQSVESSITQPTTQTKIDAKQIGEQNPPAASNEDSGVQQINNRSEKTSGDSTPYVVLASGLCVGMVAAATIVMVRKKKAQLEELESKTPQSAMAHGNLANLRTPRNNISVL